MKTFYIFLSICLGILVTCSPSYASEPRIGMQMVGTTSYYHRSLNGNLTANGERYRHMGGMTAAHRNLPFGTKLLVTDRDTGKSVTVRVNDRGPYVKSRVLDLSGLAATRLGIVKKGLGKVDIRVLSLPVPKKSKDTLGDFIYQQDNFSDVVLIDKIYTAGY